MDKLCSGRPQTADMGWLRLVGSLKLQVSFAKEPNKRDDILQKRPIILRRLVVATSCVVKRVSQKRNYSNDNSRWYSTLVTFIFKFKWNLH